MDKRVWQEPQITVETFMANEYVAACGDSGKTYYFECNVSAGWLGRPLYYYPDSDGKIDGVNNGKARMIGNYNACGKKHIAESTDTFYDGFVDYNWNGKYNKGEGVIVWRGPNGNNGHATKNLNMDSWETAKS